MATSRICDAVEQGSFWVSGETCDLVAHMRSDTLLVTFDNLASINERGTTRPWPIWMGRRADALNYSILGVQSHQKDWYRNAEVPRQIVALRDCGFFDKFQHVCFMGTSMGGFAALCFAGLVPKARVLSFSPQSTLNRVIAPYERRYPYPHRKFDWQSPEYLDAAQYVGSISCGHVFFDPQVHEDRLHAERLRTTRLKHVRIPYAGHTLIRVLAKSGALDHLLRSYPQTGDLDAGFFHLLRNKRANKAWAKPFLAAVLARGQGKLARAACRGLYRQHGHGFARRKKRELDASGE
ncbi:hypothetical protein [Phaeobacter inhibens]|uniref:hypothetical protein n=1 Tax=Phaeobacter inhibens TaxID=221822 RepID=UPI001C2FFF41|nr:hypothetical protein [Phaeobacter inhibens]